MKKKLRFLKIFFPCWTFWAYVYYTVHSTVDIQSVREDPVQTIRISGWNQVQVPYERAH